MSEGDSLHRAAAALRTALLGKPTTLLEIEGLEGPRPRTGAAIERIDRHGRHLEFLFDDGIILHTRMSMRGAWHLYHPGQRWSRRRHHARIIIETNEWTAVAFKPALVESWRVFDQSRHPRAGRLGPDLCATGADLHECAARLAHYDRPEATVAEAILDPRVMGGVGNVNRCEVLWMCGVHPWAPVGNLPRSTCLDIVVTAAALSRAVDTTRVRAAAPDVPEGLAVYGRNGQKCARCGDVIRLAKIGEMSRLLYWCPGCQVAGEPYPMPDASDPVARSMDPHPAASRFVSEMLRQRSA